MLVVGCRMSDVGCRMSDVECRMSNVECQMSNVRCRMLDVGSQMAVLSFRKLVLVRLIQIITLGVSSFRFSSIRSPRCTYSCTYSNLRHGFLEEQFVIKKYRG